MYTKLVKATLFNELRNNTVKDEEFLNELELFIEKYKEKKHKNTNLSIPLSLFADRDLGCLEVAVKYMKENLSLNYNQIAVILNRDQRTIWSTYNKAKKKHMDPLTVKDEEYYIPCEIFVERTHGPLETLVVYLKENLGLGFKQISEILNRDYRTIWLSCKNGKKHDA
jgi:hypothetical protein